MKIVLGIAFPVEFYGLTRVDRKFYPVHTDYRQDQVSLPEFYVRRTSEFLHPRLIFLPKLLNRSNSIGILGNNVTFLRILFPFREGVANTNVKLLSEISSIL